MITLICILFFAAMYAIKGGWLGVLFDVDKASEKHWFLDFALEGAYLSGFLVSVFMLFAFAAQVGWSDTGDAVYEFRAVGVCLLIGLAWFVGVRPSMGEEAGAVGDYKEAWGEYIDHGFGRAYGVKKCLQRGIYMGALLTLVTGFTGFIIAGASMPLVYFIGNCLGRWINSERGWSYAEPLFGAVFGCAFSSYLQGGGSCL